MEERTLNFDQAQKFGTANEDSDDELEEESLLETPLDKIEPYSTFKQALLSMTILCPYQPLALN